MDETIKLRHFEQEEPAAPVAQLLSPDREVQEGVFEWLVSHGSIQTRRHYLTAIREFAGWMSRHDLRLESLRAIHVAAYMDYLAGRLRRHSDDVTLGPAQRLQQHSAIKSMLGFLEVRGLLDRNAAASVKRPRNPYAGGRGTTPALTVGELARFFGGFPRPDKASRVHDVRDHAIAATMYLAWNRVEAISRLRLRDYYQEGSRWWLRFFDKYGQIVVKEVHPELKELLDHYIDAAGIAGDPDGPLFRSGRGRGEDLSRRKFLPDNIRLMIRRRGEAVGLKGVHPQMFRVSGFTEFRELGGTIEEGQRIFAHNWSSTTELYDRSRVGQDAETRHFRLLTLKFSHQGIGSLSTDDEGAPA